MCADSSPLLECPDESLVTPYASLIKHTIRLAATAATSAAPPTPPSASHANASCDGAAGAGGGERFAEILDLCASLLALLPDAADIIRRGGRAADGAGAFLTLLADLDAEPLTSRCLRGARTHAPRLEQPHMWEYTWRCALSGGSSVASRTIALLLR